jgi:S-adenosylmethionine hydrolase
MIVLLTDFGLAGPYMGQMKAVLCREAPGVPVIDLFSDIPAFDPQAAAYLLPAYAGEFPEGAVFLCVVDPGVGSGRAALIVSADGRWFVGPDNGLFAIVARRAKACRWWDITWMPPRLSASFHGRDLFAPVAARLARGEPPPGRERAPSPIGRDWPDDLARVVYVDHFGNAMTGVRAAMLAQGATLKVQGRSLARARTFSDVPKGAPFWYENANGLAEIAVSSGRADTLLGLGVGTNVEVV